MIRHDITQALRDALSALGAGEVDFVVERPGDFAHGDYATNAALVVAKSLKKNPREVAESLAVAVRGRAIEGVERVDVAGAGFLNFTLSRDAIEKTLLKAADDASWGENTQYEGKTCMVEYTDPNPFKEFHIGHLMTNIIGESVARLLETSGAKVVRVNYQGDVGLHVAKAIWGYQHLSREAIEEAEDNFAGNAEIKKWGVAYQYGNIRYEEDTQVKKEIDLLNKVIYEKSNPDINALYDAGRALSLERFETLYKILGTKFQHYFFESEMAPRAVSLVREHIGEVFEESDGAVVYKGEKKSLHTRVFLNSLGLPTYEAKDLALAFAKQEKQKHDESIVVTASEINEYFKVVLAALSDIAPEVAAKVRHVGHGFMRLTTGKMSSRKGNIVTGESLLADLQQAARGRVDVAVGAIKYVVLRQGLGKDIIFDPEKSLSLEGDSGPYLQYARVRALSLVKTAKEAGIAPSRLGAASPNTHAQVLERVLIHFPDAVSRAAAELEPHYLTTYLTELAAAFNSWYANDRVIGGDHPQYGMLLAHATEKTLAKGLSALGIPLPEQM